MSDNLRATIAELQEKLKPQEQTVIKTKEMINQLCVFAGDAPLYPEAELTTSEATIDLAPDQYYGKPLATAVTEVFERRKASGKSAAKVREIYEVLVAGGYDFQTKNDANAMRNLRISLAKNVAKFHKLPNGLFGLTAWYPKIRKVKADAIVDAVLDDDGDDVAEDDPDETAGEDADSKDYEDLL